MKTIYGDDFFNDLEDELEIAQYNLEKEWAQQPQLYLKYAMASAHFQRILGEFEQKAKVMYATLKVDAAEDPETCLGHGVKATNDRCEAYAIQHPSYINAKDDVVQAKYNADMAMAAVFAMQQRKEALENLVKLQGMEIYSEPRVRDTEFVTKATAKQATETIKQNIRPKRRSVPCK